MLLRPVTTADRPSLAALLSRVENFTPDEAAVALELIDDSIERPESGYLTIVAQDAEAPGGEGPLVGYLCYGHTPMTAATYDLYWMAVDGARRGLGVGRRLVEAFEAAVQQAGGRLIRVETSSRDGYDGTLAFYLRTGYEIASRIADFYGPGDDLVTLTKRLAG